VYGPDNSGKYTYAIEKLIKPMSKSGLKYKRKMEIEVNGETYNFMLSDVHFEIDLELLGTNENSIWTEFMNNVKYITETQMEVGVVLCRNFHFIENDLLTIFLTFMRSPKIKFIFCTQHYSYLPLSLKEMCKVVHLKKLCTERYGHGHETFCTKILEKFVYAEEDAELPEKYNYELREALYQLSTYNFDLHLCMQYMLFETLKSGRVHFSHNGINMNTIIDAMTKYNTNYRSIYHLEHFVLNLKMNMRPSNRESW
jgi:hypothetical protein